MKGIWRKIRANTFQRDRLIRAATTWLMTIQSCVVVVCSSIALAIRPANAAQADKDRPVNVGELVALIATADRVVVYSGEYQRLRTVYGPGGRTQHYHGPRFLYSSSLKKDISAFGQAISVKTETQFSRITLLCEGSPEIVFYRKKKVLVTVSLLFGPVIHTSLWDSDAFIHDMEKWLKWFDDRNIKAPRNRFEREQAKEEASRAAEERWVDLMPQNFRMVWQRAETAAETSVVIQIPDTKPLSRELEQVFPDEAKRIRALLFWYGSGVGGWYEDAAEKLLLEYPNSKLLAALDDINLRQVEIQGAARLFGALDFQDRRREVDALISPRLKQLLVENPWKDPELRER